VGGQGGYAPHLAPHCITCGTQINILHVDVIIANINNFPGNILGIRSAIHRGTQNLVGPRKRGIQLGIFIDNVRKRLLTCLNIGVRYADIFNGSFISAVSAVVNQLIGILRINTQVVHVITLVAEMHC